MINAIFTLVSHLSFPVSPSIREYTTSSRLNSSLQLKPLSRAIARTLLSRLLKSIALYAVVFTWVAISWTSNLHQSAPNFDNARQTDSPPPVLAYLSIPAFAQTPGITSPAAGSSVSGNVLIMGTAVIEPFQRYEIYIKQEPNGDDAFIYVTGGTQPVINGELGVINIDTFTPGIYTIRLRVVKLDGNYAEYFAPDISFNQAPAEPTPTATSSEPTPTPIPTATFTPAPQPTPIVGQVTQPNVEGGSVPDTPTPEPVAVAEDVVDAESDSAVSANVDLSSEVGSSTSADESQSISLPGDNSSEEEASSSNGITSQLGEAVGLDRLRDYFMTGMRYSAFAFLLVGLLFLAKGAFRWMLTQFSNSPR